jgi:3-(3-hydroxy-phenyl)propionate hydroxylase
VFGELSPTALQRLRRLCGHAPVRSVQVPGARSAPQALEHVRDPKGHLQGACQVTGDSWALLRPDGYLAASGETINGRLVEAIERSLGLRGDTP